MKTGDEAFVVAVKREKRSEVPREWVEIVRGTPGVTIVGASSPARVQVTASPEAVEELRRRLADYANIERVLPHSRS
jgi:hypothetical protein